MISDIQKQKKKSRFTLKGIYLTEKDSQRLEEIRRSLMHEEIVAPYSHIVSAGLLLLHTMKRDVTVKLLKLLWEERDPTDGGKTVDPSEISKQAGKMMKEFGGRKTK